MSDKYVKNTIQIFVIDKYKKMRHIFLLLNIKKTQDIYLYLINI